MVTSRLQLGLITECSGGNVIGHFVHCFIPLLLVLKLLNSQKDRDVSLHLSALLNGGLGEGGGVDSGVQRNPLLVGSSTKKY